MTVNYNLLIAILLSVLLILATRPLAARPVDVTPKLVRKAMTQHLKKYGSQQITCIDIYGQMLCVGHCLRGPDSRAVTKHGFEPVVNLHCLPIRGSRESLNEGEK